MKEADYDYEGRLMARLPLSRRRGIRGWWEALTLPRFFVRVEFDGGYGQARAAGLETAREVAMRMMDVPGANAEAVIYGKDGFEVERVRRGA